MRVPRGYHDGELAVGTEVVLGEALASHLTRVLRLRSGDGVRLFDGRGLEVRAVLAAPEKRRMSACIEAVIEALPESPLRLTLAQGICRGEKMDLVLQKATELGVQAIQPLLTLRTEVRLDAERASRRMAHWREVVVAACAQCGRATLPQLHAPMALPHWLATLEGDRSPRLLLDPQGTMRLSDLAAASAMLLAVGPEGGFDEDEAMRMQGCGFAGLRLGPRVLRTETAGLAAIAALQARCGDL
ncbi:MAG: 16S rRNA (uracil(1498)-N(3))-methyltransferase [Xanthomonadales bacterium PRO6]|nr:Ribosomal RNA small subunit methyltransferase E [Xanthomonadales bacterium]MCE7930017.1 16S rRNA (uracil(1498)-N(3))-methyltransferase [Xanthomonadales bacterium PRO6]